MMNLLQCTSNDGEMLRLDVVQCRDTVRLFVIIRRRSLTLDRMILEERLVTYGVDSD